MTKYLFYFGVVLMLSCSNIKCDHYWINYNENSECSKYFIVNHQSNCTYHLLFAYGYLISNSVPDFKMEGELAFTSNTVELIQKDKKTTLFNYNWEEPVTDSIYCVLKGKTALQTYTICLEKTIKTLNDTIYKFKIDDFRVSRDIDNLTFFISKTNGVVGMYASVDNPYYKIDEITMHTGNIYGDEKYILHTSHY